MNIELFKKLYAGHYGSAFPYTVNENECEYKLTTMPYEKVHSLYRMRLTTWKRNSEQIFGLLTSLEGSACNTINIPSFNFRNFSYAFFINADTQAIIYALDLSEPEDINSKTTPVDKPPKMGKEVFLKLYADYYGTPYSALIKEEDYGCFATVVLPYNRAYSLYQLRSEVVVIQNKAPLVALVAELEKVKCKEVATSFVALPDANYLVFVNHDTQTLIGMALLVKADGE